MCTVAPQGSVRSWSACGKFGLVFSCCSRAITASSASFPRPVSAKENNYEQLCLYLITCERVVRSLPFTCPEGESDPSDLFERCAILFSASTALPVFYSWIKWSDVSVVRQVKSIRCKFLTSISFLGDPISKRSDLHTPAIFAWQGTVASCFCWGFL